MIGDEELYRSRRIAFQVFTALLVAFLVDVTNAQTATDQIGPSPYGSSQRLNPSTAVVITVLLCLFFFVGFLSICIRHCYGLDSAFITGGAGGWSRRGGLDDAILETFPVFAYSSVKDIKIGSGTLECAVCLSEFEENETLRLLPRCSHVFHVDCIDHWLYSHISCPVCRARLTPESVKLSEHDPAGTGSSAESNDLVNTESRDQVDQARDNIAIDVEDYRIGESEAIGPELQRDERRRSRIMGKFPRSNSTGHSMAQLANETDRYTLRLPEDVRKRIMAANSGGMKRAKSYDAVLAAAEGSTRRGYRSGGEDSSRGRGYAVGSGGRSDRVSFTDRWGLFFSKMGAVGQTQTDHSNRGTRWRAR